MRADIARGLAVRLRRLENDTPKGGRTGTLVELEGAEKDVKRSTERLTRARAAHALATAEVQEYAETLKGIGGKPELPEGFSVYQNQDRATETAHTGQPLVDFDPDEIDGDGNPTDPEREPEVTPDDADDDGASGNAPAGTNPDSGPVRVGGRFARRGAQVG